MPDMQSILYVCSVLGIALARIRFSYPELRQKITDMQDDGLTTDQLRSLEEFLPTAEEEGQVRKVDFIRSSGVAFPLHLSPLRVYLIFVAKFRCWLITAM